MLCKILLSRDGTHNNLHSIVVILIAEFEFLLTAFSITICGNLQPSDVVELDSAAFFTIWGCCSYNLGILTAYTDYSTKVLISSPWTDRELCQLSDHSSVSTIKSESSSFHPSVLMSFLRPPIDQFLGFVSVQHTCCESPVTKKEVPIALLTTE